MEAFSETMRDGVADAESIDKAMINGVNYPFGPMTWACAARHATGEMVVNAALTCRIR
ncbi:3-hydroxyacyl-CoA dehydrogenase family protein [Hyphococcus luteus]|uniref:3-hydroxyacyl-CoA dehydrogenase C-terminal domain-containing protein n=1 Tax=Hyphococcus luteus TaxID=2058213 RepID=A0A2S7K1L3_9PROT|nr:3-hydroxyacyl-CoA dehydrogenase family protein [Marinicaulis flavus]PQA86392.1 hypothetical protein CW354_18855 [Marinicaulis flavus]